MARKVKAFEPKRTWVTSRTYQNEERTVTVRATLELNLQKLDFKIKADLTSAMLHPTNPDFNAGVVRLLGEMQLALINLAIRKRQEYIDEQMDAGVEDGQLGMFEEELDMEDTEEEGDEMTGRVSDN